MKNNKKIAAVIIAALGMLCIAIPTIANNHEDQDWYAQFYAGHYSVDTVAYEKQDDSSTYIWFYSGDAPYIFVKIFGCINLNKYNSYDCSGWYQGSGFPATYTIYPNTYGNRYFTNSVNELGYDYSFLRIMINYINCEASGVWSPDSV